MTSICVRFFVARSINRHIEVDDNKHGPMAHNLLNEICGNDKHKESEALETAILALKTRIDFWDRIHISINAKKSINSYLFSV